MRFSNQKSSLTKADESVNVCPEAIGYFDRRRGELVALASIAPLSNAASCDAGLNSATNSDVKLDTVNSTFESRSDRDERARIDAEYGKLPLSFEANQRQDDSRGGFIAHGMGYDLSLAQTDALLTFGGAGSPRSPLRMSLVGGNKNARGQDSTSCPANVTTSSGTILIGGAQPFRLTRGSSTKAPIPESI